MLSLPDPPQLAHVPSSSVVVTKGISPVPLQLIAKIHRWEFVDLSQFLMGSDPGEGSSSMMDGHIIPSHPYGKASSSGKTPPTIMDITSWLQAFSRFMAVLLSTQAVVYPNHIRRGSSRSSCPSASHPPIGPGPGWQTMASYDWEYREWAAAKSVRVWEELNLSIYGRCLPRPSAAVPQDSLTSEVLVCYK